MLNKDKTLPLDPKVIDEYVKDRGLDNIVGNIWDVVIADFEMFCDERWLDDCKGKDNSFKNILIRRYNLTTRVIGHNGKSVRQIIYK